MLQPTVSTVLCVLVLSTAALASEAVAPASASTAIEADRAQQRAMVDEMRAALAAAREKIDALVAEIGDDSTPEARTEMHARVGAIKRAAQRRQLEIQVEYAERRGDTALASRLSTEIADFDARFGRDVTPSTEGRPEGGDDR